MTSSRFFVFSFAAALVPWLAAAELRAQDFPSEDPIIRAIWAQGMEEGSHVEQLAQVLMDSVGPRLSGSPGQRSSIEWAVSMYEGWDIPVRTEQYGTWRGWDRGYTHIDLVAPRKRTLNGTMLAWSPGTEGPVEGEVIAMPLFGNQADFEAWVPDVAEKFVAIWYAEPTCRAPESWAAFATPESQTRMQALQQNVQGAWGASIQSAGGLGRVASGIERAGAAGIVTSRWSNGWGANKIFSSYTSSVPSIHLSCEDYGLVHRLASNDQGPVLRVDAEAEFLGEVPVFNVIGELRGSELPDEYWLCCISAFTETWASRKAAVTSAITPG